jgi:acyl transferase domain-containing protein
LFSQVLANGGVHPNDVSYVEMHGTGTQAGDSGEMSSVSKTFAPFPPGDPRGRDSDLYVGSVKSNVGHGESVAGVTALIKILLMLQKNEIPPHCGIKTKINRSFPLDLHDRRIQIAKQAIPWVRTDKPRRVVVNNFSAAGGNTCVLLEEGPIQSTEGKREDTRPAHVVTVSAKTPMALEANIRSLAQFLRTSDAVSLPDLAYTSTARRAHYNFRASYVAQNIQGLTEGLEQDAANPPKQVRGPPRMILAFSGQGSNRAGMGKSLYDTNATFRMDLNRFDAIVQDQGFGSILPYIRGTETATPESSPLTAQLAHVSIQMALTRLWKSWGIVPAAVVGHSLGEYAALNCAGVLSDFDVLWICGQRAKLLAAYCQEGTHAMLAVRCSQQEVVASLVDVAVEVACINGLRETVISGSNEDIGAASRQLESRGIKCNRINLPFAFHSSQLQPILDPFANVLDGITLRSPTIPILSPLLSKVIQAGDEIDHDYLLRQCREAVNLVGAVQAAQAASFLDDKTHILEIGPSLVLARLVQRTTEKPLTMIASLEPNQDSWLVLSRGTATAYRVGCNVNWAQYHRDYDHSTVQLPSYSWDLKNYWMQYVNDWSLRKGEPLPLITAGTGEARLKIATTCCQTVISAEFSASDAYHRFLSCRCTAN